MSDEPKISSEESACAEKWYDELSCGSADGVHRCRVSGRHSDHFCQDCDAMVIEDRS